MSNFVSGEVNIRGEVLVAVPEAYGTLPKGSRSTIRTSCWRTPFAESLSREFITTEWSSPMETLAALQSYCDRGIADAVGASEGSVQQSARLRLVLGDRFEDYRCQFETHRREEAAVRQAKTQHQADARAAREIQKRAREPYRAPEVRDRVEPRPRLIK